jgi:hypothetical protein
MICAFSKRELFANIKLFWQSYSKIHRTSLKSENYECLAVNCTYYCIPSVVLPFNLSNYHTAYCTCWNNIKRLWYDTCWILWYEFSARVSIFHGTYRAAGHSDSPLKQQKIGIFTPETTNNRYILHPGTKKFNLPKRGR